MSIKIELPNEIIPDFNKIVTTLGFSKKEFIEKAVKDKILEFKKQMFFQITDKVAEALRKKGVTNEEILKDFNRFRKAQ